MLSVAKGMETKFRGNLFLLIKEPSKSYAKKYLPRAKTSWCLEFL